VELGLRGDVDTGAPVGGGGGGLTVRQRAVLAHAFADAINEHHDPDPCPACAVSPAGQCGQHQADERLTAVYAAVAREMGITPEPHPVSPETILRIIAIGEGQ
jgi:hypothetical protein